MAYHNYECWVIFNEWAPLELSHKTVKNCCCNICLKKSSLFQPVQVSIYKLDFVTELVPYGVACKVISIDVYVKQFELSDGVEAQAPEDCAHLGFRDLPPVGFRIESISLQDIKLLFVSGTTSLLCFVNEKRISIIGYDLIFIIRSTYYICLHIKTQ